MFTAINRLKMEGDSKSFDRNRTTSKGAANPSATCEELSGEGWNGRR